MSRTARSDSGSSFFLGVFRMAEHEGLIHSDPLRFGLDGKNCTPATTEFQIAESILDLARALHEYMKETTDAEAVLTETCRALVKAVSRYWGCPEEYGCPECETKPEPTAEVKKRI